MTNPDVYPVTAAFEKEVRELKLKEIGKAVAQRMITHLGEYEHGVAEPEVLVASELADTYMNARRDWDEIKEGSDEEDELKNKLRKSSLETMKEMFLDYLRTYWTVDKPADITVWMPDDDTAMSVDVREDVERVVKACKGHALADEGWNYIAVGPLPFSPEEASEAMKQQSGDEPLKPEMWTERIDS